MASIVNGNASQSPPRSPKQRVPSLHSVNTALPTSFTSISASSRSTTSTAPSPYLASMQSSPATFYTLDFPGNLGNPGPFELPESMVAADATLRSPAPKENGASSTKSSGGLIRKISVTAKAGVQSTGQRLRRKTSSSRTREHSTGPITRRRSDSKTLVSNGASVVDLAFADYGSINFSESLNSLGFQDSVSSTTEPLSPISVDPEGTAPTVPAQLIDGSLLTKVTKKKRKLQPFFLNVEGSRVSWSGTVRPKYFWIDDIRGFRTGEEAFVNRQELKCLDVEPDRWLTILYGPPDRSKQTKSLNLIAQNKDNLRLWVDTLEALSKHREDLMTGMTGSAERESVIRAHWDHEISNQKPGNASSPDASGLQLAAIESLCSKLHIHCPKTIIHEHFSLADVRRIGRLNFEQFKDFVRRLKERQDFRPIFNSLKSDNLPGLTKSQFLSFLENIQGVDVFNTQSKCEDEFAHWIEKAGSRPRASLEEAVVDNTYMGYDAFSSFLLSKACNIYDTFEVKPNFNRPLNEYFISSSHNTYLKGRQVAGESSTEAYITALRRGCRCVEIDCWNGADGRPRVTHGRTGTTTVLFADCINVIGRYAFEASAYPLVLSLEVHCDAAQQRSMVHIMTTTLGEKLVTKPLSETSSTLPSPESLKYRILVKVKSSSASLDHVQSLDLAVVGRQRSLSSPYRRPVIPSTPAIPPLPKLPSPATTSSPASQSDSTFAFTERSLPNTSASSGGEESDTQPTVAHTNLSPNTKINTSNIIPLLSALGVYLQGYKYRGFKAAEAAEFNHIFSLDEAKAISICNSPEEKAQFEDHNNQYMSRVYPRSTRVGSSNFDPNIFWRRGVQMVALNWQTYDQNMQMNQAMFASGSDQYGYVLKPDYMRLPRMKNGDISHRLKLPRQSIKFSVEIISAQQLPRLPTMNRTVSINPFIDVQLISAEDKSRGIASGTGGEESSARTGWAGIGSPYSRRTKVVPDNGYNPQYNDLIDLSLETKYPELVFVRFIVWNSPDGRYVGNKCKQLAVFTSKLSSLQQGYRHIPLFNGAGEEFIFSSLFCRIKKSEPRLIPTSLQDLNDRSSGRGLIRTMLSRNLSSERGRDRATSLEKQSYDSC